MKNKGFILLLALIVPGIVLGTTAFLGSTYLKKNFDRQCGENLKSWQTGDIYGDIVEGSTEALDGALKCREAVYDTVAKAKPVAALISASGNMPITRKDFAQAFIIDRIMDSMDNLGNPEHKNPVRDSILPPAVTKKLDDWKKEDAVKNKPKSTPSKIKPIEKTPQISKPVKNNFINTVGTRSIKFTDSKKKEENKQGMKIIININTKGNISFNFHENKSLTCRITMNSNINTSMFASQIKQNIKNNFKTSGASTQCSGSVDSSGDFVFSGNISSKAQNIPGQNKFYAGAFKGSGFIDSDDGKIIGDLTFKSNGSSLDFFE